MVNEPKLLFLKPGELIVCRRPTLITTILGSCVSVCLYDPINKIGGINHFIMPTWNHKGLADLKYGDVSMNLLIQEMRAQGSVTFSMVATIIGGSNALCSTFKIGQKNIELAETVLKRFDIKIIGRKTGGKSGRKVKYNSNDNTIEIFDLNN